MGGDASGGSGDNSAFETLAAQQRARREEQARQTGSEAANSAEKMYQSDVANPLVRFGQ